MTFTHALSTNRYGEADLIVSTSAANGTHTTLASAMSAAVSGQTIFLRNSVTENVTITPGVNIAAWTGSTLNTPSITGTLTMTGAGTSTISGLTLITNSAFAIAVTGSAASILRLNNCYINALNNTAISYTSSSSSSEIDLIGCTGDIGTTGIAIFANSGAGRMRIIGGQYLNTGASTTANTVSAGSLFPESVDFNNPLTVSGTTGRISAFHFAISCSSLNVTALTVTSTNASGSEIDFGTFRSGSASAISVGAGAILGVDYCDVSSTNTNPVTGAGTLNYGSILNFNTTLTGTINTTTQTPFRTHNGITTSTLQPAFQAFLTNDATNVTGAGTVYNVSSNAFTEIFDQNANFDATTGVFTAPITARYQFNFTIALAALTAAMTTGNMNIFTSNRQYLFNLLNYGAIRDNADLVRLTGSVLADMDATDTANLGIVISNGAGDTVTLSGTSGLRTTFSGNLEC